MQLSRILSACALNGVTVDKKREGYYVLTKGENSLTMYVQDGQVGHLTYHSPQTDAMRDCFCDCFYHTIKSAMHALNPSGELVKPTKPSHDNDAPTVENVVVSKNDEKNGIEIRFPEKPSHEIIDDLKGKGFRYSSFGNLWWKRYNDADYEYMMNKFGNVCQQPELIGN